MKLEPTQLDKFNGEMYKGYIITCDAARDLWIRHNGWQIGYAASLADSKRAIDLLEGTKWS